jgi:hypothetical protein
MDQNYKIGFKFQNCKVFSYQKKKGASKEWVKGRKGERENLISRRRMPKEGVRREA